MLRVFVGIPVSKEIGLSVSALKEEFQELPLRWVSGDGLHITLVPPWYVTDADCAVGDLREIASVSPFEIRFRKITFGTSPSHPRLLWTMGEDYDKEKIAALKGLCEVVFGQRAENRPYVPHLTIARFKEEDFAGLPAALEKEVSWKMKIDSVALYESKLYHSGAEYEILRKIELRG